MSYGKLKFQDKMTSKNEALKRVLYKNILTPLHLFCITSYC